MHGVRIDPKLELTVKGIYIQPDLTQIQRKIQFSLRRDLREKRANGEDVVIEKGNLVDRKSSLNFRSQF